MFRFEHLFSLSGSFLDMAFFGNVTQPSVLTLTVSYFNLMVHLKLGMGIRTSKPASTCRWQDLNPNLLVKTQKVKIPSRHHLSQPRLVFCISGLAIRIEYFCGLLYFYGTPFAVFLWLQWLENELNELWRKYFAFPLFGMKWNILIRTGLFFPDVNCFMQLHQLVS